MKTKQNMRRLVALTLATAVTLPQASPALATSLEFTKASVIRLSEQRLTTALTQNQGESAEKQFPLLTMATATDKTSTKQAEAKWRTDLSRETSGEEPSPLASLVDSPAGEEETGDDTPVPTLPDEVPTPAPQEQKEEKTGKSESLPSTPPPKEENAGRNQEEDNVRPAEDETPEIVVPEEITDVDDTHSQDDFSSDPVEEGPFLPWVAWSMAPDGTKLDVGEIDPEPSGEVETEGEEPALPEEGEDLPVPGGPSEGLDAPSDGVSDESTDQPVGEPSEPSEKSSDGPEEPSEGSSDTPSDESADGPAQEPSEEPAEEPSDESTDQPVGEPSEPSEKPSDGSEEPSEGPSDTPSDESTDGPVQEPSDGPLDDGAGEDPEDGPDRLPAAAPEGGEVPVPLAGDSTPQMYNYVLGYGLGMLNNTEQIHSLTRYQGQFGVELMPRVAEAYYETGFGLDIDFGGYGSRVYELEVNGAYTEISSPGAEHTYAIFPSKEMLGRVPDLQFQGWYLYPYGVKQFPSIAWDYASQASTWDYDADLLQGVRLTQAVTTELTGESLTQVGIDPLYKNLGDTWDEGRSYAGYTAVGRRSGDYRDATENPVSFVGRWVPSTESRAADTTYAQVRTRDKDNDPSAAILTTTANGVLDLYQSVNETYSNGSWKGIVGLYALSPEQKEQETGKPVDLDDLKTDFSRDTYEYWLRVNADVTSLDLTFNAAEIFYDYNNAQDKSGLPIPVQVIRSFDGTDVDYSASTVGTMLPHWGSETLGNGSKVYSPNNAWNDTAYSEWKTTGITLEHSAPILDGAGTVIGYKYNDIKVRVLSPSAYEKVKAGLTPDSSEVTTYTFHVQRLSEPTLAQEYGNTPAGMIWRDSIWTDAEKQQAYDKFFGLTGTSQDGTYQFERTAGAYPSGIENRNGTIFREEYTTDAWWKGPNIDADSKAIVVYLDSTFREPGLTLIDSEGVPRAISGTSEWTVFRKLELKTVDALTIDNLTTGTGTGTWYSESSTYSVDRLADHPVGDVLQSGRDRIDLRGMNILPGVYTLQYEFIDPLTGWTYSADYNYKTSAGAAGAGNFNRTMVVLPIPGDVDMDGVVTSADAEVLRKYLQDPGEYGGAMTPATINGIPLGTGDRSTARVNLFAYRVADVTHDGGLSNKIAEPDTRTTDVNALEAVPMPQVVNFSGSATGLSWSDYYYIPLEDLSTGKRPDMQLDPGATGAKLELVYLGKERAANRNEKYRYFDRITGPWKGNPSDGMEIGDVMWLGVKLTNGAASELLKNNGVDTLTFTLVYDASYVEPAMVLDYNAWNGLGGVDADPEVLWRNTLEIYNTGNQSQTAWGDKSAYAFTQALRSERALTVYDAKAKTPLEKSAGTSHLRELVFSVKLRSGAQAVKLNEDEQWLLTVPFLMVQHPVNGVFQRVEMSAGMSDFTVVFTDGPKMTTAAYNPTLKNGEFGDIFGNSTKNLAKEIAFANAGPKVPLGTDKSKIYYIRNETILGSTSNAGSVIYSTPFQAQLGWTKDAEGNFNTANGSFIQIPRGMTMRNTEEWEWLKYDRQTGYIYGTPEAAGTYNFTIAEYRFQMVVEKAELRYWVDNIQTYYGEEEYRGQNSAKFATQLRYQASDIRSIEVARAEDLHIDLNAGRGTDLDRLLADVKYVAPAFTAVDSKNSAIGVKTPATGEADSPYPITLTNTPFSSNYELKYDPSLAGTGAGGVTILKRPFVVKQLTPEVINQETGATKPVGEIYSDETSGVITSGLRVTLSDSKKEFEVDRMPRLETDPATGYYAGLPYTGKVLLDGDSLVLSYWAELLQNEEDLALQASTGARYDLGAKPMDTRPVEVSNLAIVSGTNSSNYTLKDYYNNTHDKPLVNGWDSNVIGTVRQRTVSDFAIKDTPKLIYNAGERLTAYAALLYYIEKEGTREGVYPYNEETTRIRDGIQVTWATAEEMAKGQIGSLEYHANQVFTMDYDGRYLCLSTERRPDNKLIVTYWEEQPLKINPLPLTLTAVETTRFYGEENGELHFTYDPNQLSSPDQELLRAVLGITNLGTAPRDGAELKNLFQAREEEDEIWKGLHEGETYYQMPTLDAIDTTDVERDGTGKPVNVTTSIVTQESDANDTAYAILIQGARYPDYEVKYSYSHRDESNVWVTTTQSGWGAARYRVERRPIVVEALRYTETRDKDLITLYADTKRLYVEGRELQPKDVVLSLPVEGGQVWYYQGGGGRVTRDIGFAGTDAIVNGDQISFRYTVTAISQDGDGYAKWTNFAKGHFNMSDADEGNKYYPVQISGLTVQGDDARNYVLVYRDNTSAGIRGPAGWVAELNCISADPVESKANANETYYAPRLALMNGDQPQRYTQAEYDQYVTDHQGETPGWKVGSIKYAEVLGGCTVTLRPIQEIEILSPGKLDYTYGDQYAPTKAGGGSNQGMRVGIHYRRDYDHGYTGNLTYEELRYQFGGEYDEEGKLISTFAERGLAIYYQSDTKQATSVDENKLIDYGDPLFVDPHHGVYLVVAGKRGDQASKVVSRPWASDTVTVGKRELTLRAVDQYRFYGEENGPVEFTFDVEDLAPWDREQIAATGQFSSERLKELRRESGADYHYAAPRFAHEATATSDVRSGGRAGYRIYKAADGSLDNYTLKYESGTLYIYPRLVQIKQFNSSADNPIYTIRTVGTDVTANIFDASALVGMYPHETTGQMIQYRDFVMEVPDAFYPVGPAGVNLTAKDRSVGVLPGDSLALKLQVSYPVDWKKQNSDNNQTEFNVTVIKAELMPGDDSDNYVLYSTPDTTWSAVGAVALRRISEVKVVGVPQKLEYDYGETLALQGLAVSISYMVEGDLTPKETVVYYTNTVNFAGQGLYVNYYPDKTLRPEDDPESLEEQREVWSALRSKYYTASTGDHLTIAPTHESMLHHSSGPKWNFAADGQFLVITAQREENQVPARPILVAAGGEPVQIKVNPAPLTFRLSAQDKTYDGNTQAAGTLTLDGVYDREVTDVVYPVTGAAYEADWDSQAFTAKGEAAFAQYLADHQNRYTFTTGRYVPADESPLGQNYDIDWESGYKYGASGVMKFAFRDPNVANTFDESTGLYGAVGTKPVELLGLRLMGPDAKNYTLNGHTGDYFASGNSIDLTQDTLAELRGNGYSDTDLPTATIHKANRAVLDTPLPTVEVDPNTNVVRIVYDYRPADVVKGDDLQEARFEYALQYDATGKPAGEDEEGQEPAPVTPAVGHWTALDGRDTWGDPYYSSSTYFGGEAVTLEYPEGYVPREEDIPKAGTGDNVTLKGQIYQWAGEDPGFQVDLGAYPGENEEPWPDYFLYGTDRTALARDTVYWALVRVGETRNYKASPAISSVEAYTPEMIQAFMDALYAVEYPAVDGYEEAVEAQAEASARVLEAVQEASDAAKVAARAESESMAEIAESGKWPEEGVVREAAAAVKTYVQRIDLVSMQDLRGEAEPGALAKDYQVPTLEAVWFTDVLLFADQKELDPVTRNLSPSRYQSYAWDPDRSVVIFTGNEPLDLRGPDEIEITKKGEDTEGPDTLLVNEDHTARLYVELVSNKSTAVVVQEIRINSEDLVLSLDTEPFRLTVTIRPMNAIQRVVWTSSNESVVRIAQDGTVTVVGVGVAMITATAVNGLSDSIIITVKERMVSIYPNGIFDSLRLEPFFQLDEPGGLFHPEWAMTRGEVARLLAQFYIENPLWTLTGPESFPDITGKESYAEAVLLLSRNGLIVGMPDGRFAGDQGMTRAEFVTLLVRMLALEVPDTTGQTHAFLDIKEDECWAYREIDAMSKLPGVLLGVGEGCFAPNRPITRAEAATLLTRLIQFPDVEENPRIPRDVGENHWARKPIVRSVNQGVFVPVELTETSTDI